jgi:hypothetical protein
MLQRVAVSLFALVLLVTTGVTSSTAYLCLMDGQVHSECCCKKSETKSPDDCPKVERDDRCCELQVTGATRPPATARDGLANGSAALSLLASLPMAVDAPPPRAAEGTLPISARGPPFRMAPPLFVWNCSFLI